MNLTVNNQKADSGQETESLISAFQHFEQISEQLQQTYLDMDQRAAMLTQTTVMKGSIG